MIPAVTPDGDVRERASPNMDGSPDPRPGWAWTLWTLSAASAVLLVVVVGWVGPEASAPGGPTTRSGPDTGVMLDAAVLLVWPALQGLALWARSPWLAVVAAVGLTLHSLLFGLSFGIVFLAAPVPLAIAAAAVSWRWSRRAVRPTET